ncbi:MAG TPA: protein-L-isoaspartate(D-aspartate) O-methyltransferase [Pirellulaceae bacterium]|nr:protein-L-isoaspartate(D-aspartate) O-methyltransferase [Pirellulaceae bacterium]
MHHHLKGIAALANSVWLDSSPEWRAGIALPQVEVAKVGTIKVSRTVKQATDNFARLRQRMVTAQLRARGISDRRVLAAMLVVLREEFVPEALKKEAYNDGALPIADGQTISQPFTVAYMAEAAGLHGHEKILEVGTGSGYGAAVLSLLGADIHSIERIPALGLQATATLKRLGYSTVHVHMGDGSLGLAAEAPFDAIIVTAGAAYLPPAYTEQLAEGGRIIIPIGQYETNQHLYRFRRDRGKMSMGDLGAFAFVPLIGDESWHPA